MREDGFGRWKMFLDLVRRRRSIRVFKSEKVDRSLIERCVEAARLAPSAENLQPWRFVVFDDPKRRSELASVAFSGIYRITRWAASAPVLVVVLAKRHWARQIASLIQGSQWWLIDVGISVEHFVLQAEELGIGTCWIGWFNAKAVKRWLRLPRGLTVCCMLALGWPAESPPPRPRKPLHSILSYNEVLTE